MIFHLGFELPEPVSKELNADSPEFTAEEIKILKAQIRKNAVMIDDYVGRLDLFVNKEKYPRKAEFVNKLRERLELLMEENDTFREVLWTHFQKQDLQRKL